MGSSREGGFLADAYGNSSGSISTEGIQWKKPHCEAAIQSPLAENAGVSYDKLQIKSSSSPSNSAEASRYQAPPQQRTLIDS